MNTKPSEAALSAIKSAAKQISDVDPSMANSDYLKYHKDRLAIDFDWINSHIDIESILLEIGGQPFFLTLSLKNHGFNVKTIDILSESASKVANQLELRVTACDIEKDKLPFDDNSFDEIILNEVFEHLRLDLIFTMSEILRVLKPGGRLWLSTPNLRSIRGIYNFIFKSESWSVVGEGLYAQYMSLRTHGYMGHNREYTSKEVANFITSIGFKVEKIVYRGGYKNTFANISSKIFPSLNPYFSIISKKISV